ncbi:hypothetical protein NDU88_003237 [Pleurodeles waltl]|uniref:Uncharacterized protein n=1 Tax=Pleurodeles waltl TaxID=8319 RepID=A0AAV7SF29_PLEWA|nr:hypothetical protein NDU88_003237 [Pleurodeles waltl]
MDCLEIEGRLLPLVVPPTPSALFTNIRCHGYSVPEGEGGTGPLGPFWTHDGNGARGGSREAAAQEQRGCLGGPLTPGAKKSEDRECLWPSGSDAGSGAGPQPRWEPPSGRDRRANGILTPAGGAPGAAPGGATPSSAPERGARRTTARAVGATEIGRLRGRQAPWFGRPDTGSPNTGALTQAARPQKVGGIKGRALEIRTLGAPGDNTAHH